MTAPVVLISAHRRGVDSDLGRHRANVVPEPYLERLDAAGATPVIAWPGGRAVDRLLSLVQGALLIGGGDVAPSRFGSTRSADAVDEGRDEFEIDLVHGCRRRRIPLLGLCRGVQVLNVAFGGTLLPVTGHRQDADLSQSSHAVELADGCRLSALLGSSDIKANSFHRWAIDRVGEGFRPVANAHDGILEGIEAIGDWWCVGIQWHAELLGEAHAQALFDGFVSALGEEPG